MSKGNLGLGILLGGITTFTLGKYLLSDEGTKKATDLLEKVKNSEELKNVGSKIISQQFKK